MVGCSLGDYEGGSGNTNVGIALNVTTDKYAIVGNKLEGNGGAAISGGSISSTKVIKDNIGFVTEKRGNATIVAANTSVVVPLGLNITPASITLTPKSDIGDATKYWVSAQSSAQFTITLDQAPGDDVVFSWDARS